MLTIRKRQMEFTGHIMRKEGQENLRLTSPNEGKRGRWNQGAPHLTSFIYGWLNKDKERSTSNYFNIQRCFALHKRS